MTHAHEVNMPEATYYRPKNELDKYRLSQALLDKSIIEIDGQRVRVLGCVWPYPDVIFKIERVVDRASAPPTCLTCQHWHRKPWPNGLGWHNQGTCAALSVAARQLVVRPNGIHPALETPHDFGCLKHESRNRSCS